MKWQVNHLKTIAQKVLLSSSLPFLIVIPKPVHFNDSWNHSLIVYKTCTFKIFKFHWSNKTQKKKCSLLSPGEEITVQVYAIHKINKNRKPHIIEIDSIVISTVATAPDFR